MRTDFICMKGGNGFVAVLTHQHAPMPLVIPCSLLRKVCDESVHSPFKLTDGYTLSIDENYGWSYTDAAFFYALLCSVYVHASYTKPGCSRLEAADSAYIAKQKNRIMHYRELEDTMREVVDQDDLDLLIQAFDKYDLMPWYNLHERRHIVNQLRRLSFQDVWGYCGECEERKWNFTRVLQELKSWNITSFFDGRKGAGYSDYGILAY